MALLKSAQTFDAKFHLSGERIYLRVPCLEDFSMWRDLRFVSQDYLKPWEPTWAEDDLTKNGYRRRLRYYQKNVQNAEGYSFFIFCQSSDLLLGGITVSNIRRGVAQMATLGYWVGEAYKSKGVMSEAVKLVRDFSFHELGLHRLEAACLLDNKPSQKVLKKCGFKYEGIAAAYLKINGKWQDHMMFADINTE